ncbi:MAG: hypothetical protein FJW14_00455 [Acidimicrobiia bacterium]|nr:hypothetical protein [Acidimicrobiia bacterium]
MTAHTLRGETLGERLWPAFPLAATAIYLVTGNLVSSFQAVNFVGFLVLILAAALILDARRAPLSVKVCALMTLTLAGWPVGTAAYSAAQPYLFGVALTTLGVAACETGGSRFIAAAQIASVFGSPVGVASPVFGTWRSWRLNRRRLSELFVFAPGLLVWLLIQTWARGGPSGLRDLLRFSRVRSDVVLWTEPVFMMFGAYFLVTVVGGLTILLCSRPRWIGQFLGRQPEMWALVAVPLVFTLTGGVEAQTLVPFLIPFWLLAVGTWAHEQKSSLLAPVMLAGLLTVLTQHPWAGMDDAAYFVDWWPYSVHAARVSGITVDDTVFNGIWRVRVLIALGGLIACALWWRRADKESRPDG